MTNSTLTNDLKSQVKALGYNQQTALGRQFARSNGSKSALYAAAEHVYGMDSIPPEITSLCK